MFASEQQNRLNNSELVRHCASDLNNKKAWLEFRSRYEEHIYNQVVQQFKNLELYRICFQFDETVRDLVQDVYLKLLANDCKALKTFRGVSENSIYSYLGVIARNVVKNHVIKGNAQKRPRIEKSLDDVNLLNDANGAIHRHDRNISSLFVTEPEFALEILKEEIDYCLARTLTGRAKMRNKLIYQLHLYDGLSADEIAVRFEFRISTKRIANIISNSKRKLMKIMSLAKHHENLAC